MRIVPPPRPRHAATRHPTRPLARPAACLPLVALALLLALSGPADAQWKWRDKDGRITVSDRPPTMDIADKDILSRPAAAVPRSPAPAASAPAAAAPPATTQTNPPAEPELEARKRAAEQEQAARQKAEEDKLASNRAENCRRARSHFAALESGQRLARINEKGEREVLDDKGRADEMRQAREVIAADCR